MIYLAKQQKGIREMILSDTKLAALTEEYGKGVGCIGKARDCLIDMGFNADLEYYDEHRPLILINNKECWNINYHFQRIIPQITLATLFEEAVKFVNKQQRGLEQWR